MVGHIVNQIQPVAGLGRTGAASVSGLARGNERRIPALQVCGRDTAIRCHEIFAQRL